MRGLNIFLSGIFLFILISCSQEKTVSIPENEFQEVTKHIESLIKRDSLNQAIIRELKGQGDSSPVSEVQDTIVTSNGLPDGVTPVPDQSLWLFILEGIVLGFLALLMPCVYPMIPMTVSFFTKGSHTKTEGLKKALMYGFSIVFIYTFITIIPALIFGQGFAHAVSTHWLPNLIFFAIFIAFGLSFLGMYEIVLPSSMVNSVDRKADKGGYTGIFFMAFTLVLVSFSCTAPFVSHVMTQVTEGKLIYPVVGMLSYSITFALPFVFFALFPSLIKSLPKSGSWMNTIRTFLGFLEIGLALKFLSNIDLTYGLRILDRDVFIGLWIALSVVLGMYLLGFFRLPHDEEKTEKISVLRLLWAILVFWFAIYLWPGLSGAPLNGLSGILPPMDHHDFDVPTMINNASCCEGNQNSRDTGFEKPKYADHYKMPTPFKGYFEYEQALRVAKKAKKPLFIDFTGKGCANCRRMEQNVWAIPGVKEILMNEYTMVALYTDDRIVRLPADQIYTNEKGQEITYLADKNKELEAKFGDIAQPYYVLLDPFTEKVLVPPVGYTPDAEAYTRFLKQGIETFKKLHP
jgi:thiol:disulfide interchange protein DsbD